MALRKKTNDARKKEEEMPGLIFNNIKIAESDENKNEFLITRARKKTTAKKWMWIGAVGFSVIIFFIAAWSFKIKFSGIQWDKSPENEIINSAQKDLNNLFSETKESELQKLLIATQIKDVISQILNNAAADSAATSSINKK